jgi:hypothetical protein
MATKEQIRVIIAKEGDYWVAQCLEYDIGAQARELDQLRNRLVAAMDAEYKESMRRHGKAFAGIDPAPRYFRDLWNHRSKTFIPSSPTTVQDDPSIEIEFALAA